jgi:hypothetical protein
MSRCALLAAVLFLTTACFMRPTVQGSGTPASSTRSTGSFDELAFSGTGTLRVTIGDGVSVIVSGDDNIVPLIQTELTGSKLAIFTKSSIAPKVPLVIAITAPSLKSLELSGATAADVSGLNEKAIELSLSGASNATLSGRADHLAIDASGASRATATMLACDVADVECSGASSADVSVAKELRADASGAANIVYHGDPKVRRATSGAAKVTRGQ